MNKSIKVTDLFSKYAIIIVLIFEIVIFAIAAPAFTNAENIFNILRQVSIVGIMSVGMTMVIISGGLDLSVGAVCGLVGVIVAKFMVDGFHPVVAVILGLIVGLIVGLVNGLLVSVIRVTPLIATLGTMTVCRGLAFLISDGIPVYGFTKAFTVIGQGYVGVVPIPVIIMAVVFFVGYIILNRATFGRRIYGVGSSEEVSRLSGVNIAKVKCTPYIISGFLSALTGIILLSRLNSGIPNTGNGYEMDVITAVVLGGVSIKGGEGKLLLVIVGVLIMGVLSNGLVLLGVNIYVQQVLQGVVLIVAITIDCLTQLRKERTV